MIFLLPLNKSIRLSKALYKRSFPAKERRDWADILLNQTKPYFDFWEIYSLSATRQEQSVFCGIVSVWSFSAFVYIEHFAVEERFRNKGIGSATLKHLKQQYKKPVVLEVDMPYDDIAKKRVDFYTKNGFILLDNKYIQPPYKQGLPSVEMQIMTSDKNIPFANIKQTLYRHVYAIDVNQSTNLSN